MNLIPGRSFLAIVLAAVLTSALWGQADDGAEAEDGDAKDAQQALFDGFAKRMSNSALVGHFTIDGREGDLKQERYELKGVSKMANGDYWLFRARIRYGDHDVTLPLPLEVKWAASTPVITLDSVVIPGLGTFSARVVIDEDRYAGTWQHGEVGGHLFGRVESAKEKVDGEEQEKTQEDKR